MEALDVKLFFTKVLQEEIGFKLNYDYRKEEEMVDFLEESVNHDHKFKCSKPKKPHLKPNPNADEDSASNEKLASFNCNLAKPSFNF